MTINWTPNITTYRDFQQERGDRFCVSAHIRPGEYTAQYATSPEEVERIKARFLERGCHQIQVKPPIEGES